MVIASFVSLAITALLIILSLAFKVAGKLRLSLPLLYFLVAVASTFFTDWTTENELLVLMGLYVLIGLVALNCIYSLVKKIHNRVAAVQSEKSFEQFAFLQVQQARKKGILPDSVRFDANGNLLDAESGKPVF